jgi:hypothetical protein
LHLAYAQHLGNSQYIGTIGNALVAMVGPTLLEAQAVWQSPFGGLFGNRPGAIPLTTSLLRQIAEEQGIGAGLEGVQKNRAIGRAFQDFVLRTIERTPLPENTRTYPHRRGRRPQAAFPLA